MHPSSFENLIRLHDRYLAGPYAEARERIEVLDVGGADVNGSYRAIFDGTKFRYRTADLHAGPGVDVPLESPYELPLPDGSVDVVVSGQMLEHCELFWLSFREMVRVLRDDGWLFLIAPSAGPVHRHPVDCYRFYPDAYAALARYAGCQLVECRLDERGPWRDLVGVFRRTPAPPDGRGRPLRTSWPAPPWEPPSPPNGPDGPEAERVRGALDYLALLARAHERLAPESYLEIGVKSGRSLALARCPAVGVDPLPEISFPLGEGARLHETSSDEFFERDAARALGGPVELAFIDGMHLFEFALRDFMNVERRASPSGLILVDDVLPNHPAQAARLRRTRAWCGDVWKLASCLREHRPDLVLLTMDARPAGLLAIAGLDPGNRVLWDAYNPLVRRWASLATTPPASVLERRGADTGTECFDLLLETLREARTAHADRRAVRARLGRAGFLPAEAP